MKTIELTQGKETIVDDEDYERIINSDYQWYAIHNRKTYYAYGHRNGEYMLMHRFIMGAPSNLEIDHINRNGLDNRRSNLRLATPSQNRCNAIYPNKTGYRGVHIDNRKNKKYRAGISINGKSKKLGLYYTAEEAAMAYDEAAKMYHGEYATLNFPDGIN